MKIRFLQDYVVRDEKEGTKEETAYKEKQAITVSASSAQHFINKGVAVEVETASAKKAAAPKQED